MAVDPSSEFLLSFTELGEQPGMSADAAERRAKRSKWPVHLGNDGEARARVATAELAERPPERDHRLPEQTESATGPLGELKRLLILFIVELRARTSKAEQEAAQAHAALDQARERITRLEADLASARATSAARDEFLAELRQALAHERGRDYGGAKRDELSTALAKSEAALEHARQLIIGRDMRIGELMQPKRPWWRGRERRSAG